MSDKLEQKLHKIDPKLRMIANGDEVVNALRAEQAPAMAVRAKTIQKLELAQMRDLTSQSLALGEIGVPERKKLEKVPDDVFVDVYIKLSDDAAKLSRQELKERGIRRAVRKHNLISAEVPLSELQYLIDDPRVISVEIPEQIRFSPPLDLAVASQPTAGDAPHVVNAP